MSPYSVFRTNRNFRNYSIGQFISMTGSWAQSIALSWLTYRLTHSSYWVGVITLALQAPAFLLSPLAGTIVDRSEKRKIFLATQCAGVIQASLLSVLIFVALPGGGASHPGVGAAILPWLIALSIFQGFNNAFEITTRHSLTIEIVERGQLSSAIALNAVINNVTRVVGPAVAGALIQVTDERWCFLINAVSYAINLFSFRRIPLRPFPKEPTDLSLWHSMTQGFRYVGNRPRMLRILAAASALSAITGTYTVLLPVFAQKVLTGSADLYAWLTTATATGAIIGTAGLQVGSANRPPLRIEYFRGLALMACGLILFSISRHFLFSLGCATFIGFFTVRSWPLMNSALQRMVDDTMRGRVMSLFMMTFLGTTPVASILAGKLSDWVGPAPILSVLGAATLLGAILYLWKNSRRLN